MAVRISHELVPQHKMSKLKVVLRCTLSISEDCRSCLVQEPFAHLLPFIIEVQVRV